MTRAIDAYDRNLIAQRIKAFDALGPAPRVGDWVDFADGVKRRISHAYDGKEFRGEESYQTSDTGRWYFALLHELLREDGRDVGYCSFSGSLFPDVGAATLTLTDERRMGWVWSFHHDRRAAGNDVEYQIELRVYRCSDAAPR